MEGSNWDREIKGVGRIKGPTGGHRDKGDGHDRDVHLGRGDKDDGKQR